MDKTIKLLVIKAEDNKRLDLYLQNKLKKYSRSLLKKIIETKGVKINGIINFSPSTKVKFKDKKYIAFSQKMYMYKINIQNIEESNWIGSKITKKKYIKSMQLLRNLKFKNYPFWRLDKRNLQIIEGGWHFSYLQSPEEILNKIKSFSHGEFNDGSISEKEIEEKILKNEDIFNRGFTLKKTEIDESYPNYIIQNKSKYSEWIL